MTEPRDPIYIRQLLSGRDHARSHPAAGQMMNFAYLVGCQATKQCLVVDPTWDPAGIVARAREDGMTVVGAIATHGHPDHAGGSMMGMTVPGLRELLSTIDGPVHAHRDERALLTGRCGIPDERLALHDDGDTIAIGEVELRLVHTPGHTAGHLVVLADGHVITGDLLFVGACGRVDLPGADARQMYGSLQKMSRLPAETVVWPGHHYGGAVRSTIGDERRTNPYLQIGSIGEWMSMMG